MCLWIRSYRHIRCPPPPPPRSVLPFLQDTCSWVGGSLRVELCLWVVATAFRSLLAELLVQGWTVEQETVHVAYVTQG